MVRREIKSFKLELYSEKVMLDAPFSLASAINSGRIYSESLGSSVTLSAEAETDGIALSNKHIFLKLGRFSAPCDVLLNGSEIGKLDGEHDSYVFDVKDLVIEGTNKVSFRFDAECDPCRIGIFDSVEMIRFNNAMIDRVSVTEKHADGAVTLGLRVDMLGNTENVRAVATLTSPVGQMYYAGLTKGAGSITVPDPLYWWPHGHGVQNLYKLAVNLYGDIDIEDSVEMRVGLRNVETVNTQDGFALSVNGLEILPMGAVYRQDPDLSVSAQNRRIEAFITYAAMANYNTLVIPADSPRPPKKFYDLCDAHGIMIMEEISDVSDGYLDTLSRISHHPSLCHLDVLYRDNSLDITEGLKQAAPELDFSVVREFPKYPSHPSLPCEKTLNESLTHSGKNPTSKEMDKVAPTDTLGKILTGVIEKYPYPASLGDLSYVSQLASANKIADFVKEARLSEGKIERAVFDSLGDNKTAATSSAIDSSARRKALEFYAHKFFAHVALFADYNDGIITFSASSQRKLDLEGILEYRIADAKNVTIYRNEESVALDGMTAKVLFTADISPYIQGHEQEYYLEYTLREGTTAVSADVMLFVPEKHFSFEDPMIYCEIVGSDKKYSITLTPKAFAKDVEIFFEGTDGVLSDNYLNLTQNAPLKITLNVTGGVETALHLKEALRIRSIYDVK